MNRCLVSSFILVLWLFAMVVWAEPPDNKAISGVSTKGRLPITISKATTYITEPLRPDGYPDYLAALNQEASAGVTPENNAVVVLMQAFGPKVIDGKNREAFFKMLGVAQSPEKGDYFIDYDEYVKQYAPDAMKEDAHGWRGPLSYQEFKRTWKRPWSREECPLVAGWLAVNEIPLALVVEASKRPHFYSPLVMRGNWLGSFNLFPSQLGIRSAVRCFVRRAMLRLHEGQIEQAWDDLQTCHRLARFPGWRDTSTWDCLAAMTCDGMASYSGWQLAHFVKLTPTQCRQFSADMEKLPTVPFLSVQLDHFERFLYLDSVCATARGSLKPTDIIPISPTLESPIRGGDTPEWRAIRESLTNWISSGHVDWDEALHLGNEHFDRIAALSRMPSLQERRIAGAALDKELLRRKVRYRFPGAKIDENRGDVKEEIAAPRSVGTRGVFVVYLAQLIDTVGTYVSCLEIIRSQLVPVALALSAYRTEHGKYPDELASLQPKYLTKLPRDPWNGSSYHYRRQDEGYLLYSVGPNGADDTGPQPSSYSYSTPPGPPTWANSDDIGIRMPDCSDADDK